MDATAPKPDIPAGTLVVVLRGRNGEQIARTCTPCYGPGRWPFVRRWLGDRWTKQPSKARVLRVATAADLALLATGAVFAGSEMPFPRRPHGGEPLLKV